MAKLFNFRCPDELKTLIEKRAIDSAQPETKVVVDALRYAFGVDEIPSDLVVGKSVIRQLQMRIEELEKKHRKLTEMIANG